MTAMLVDALFEATFRANPAYDLLAFDRLPQHQQAMLAELRADPSMYGVVFRHDSASRACKAVDRDTALLLFTLQSPSRLPSYVRALLADQEGDDIARLVLDGLLEIEHNGAFISGANAYAALYGLAPLPDATSVPARLSHAALQYAQALPIDDPMKLAARLYFYHRQPLTPFWRQQFPTQRSVDRFLGIEPEPAIAGVVERHWKRISPPTGSKGWHIWRARHSRHTSAISCKLYVSPDHSCLPIVWQATLEVLADSGAHMIKIGCDIHGLLRPDKIVVYFDDFAELQAGAARLERALGGCAAHGVPFTAAISDDGMLSWGTDPPPNQQVLSWQPAESWRVWICHRLAAALVLARQQAAQTIEPWRFAMQRIQLEGVDILTWTPAATIWQAAKEA
jgi:hypothetical protein